MTQREIMMPFAEIYWASLEPYRRAIEGRPQNNITVTRFKSEFKKGLKWPLKHSGTLVPPAASESAIAIANLYGIDLHALQWQDQPKAEEMINGVTGRNIFIHEHQIPVDRLFTMILEAGSMQEIINILMNQRIVWITREENALLPLYIRIGNEYQENGIIIVANPYGNNWMERNWRI
jgi:hypothetical protein